MADKEIVFTEQALEAVEEIAGRIGAIRATFGENSQEYLTATQSALHALLQVIRLGGRISRDGKCSLLGVSFITYGVVPHRKGEPVDGVQPTEWGVHS